MKNQANVLDTAQNLALVIGYLRKQLKIRDARFKEEFERRLSEALQALPKPSEQTLVETVPYVLPDSVAHDANLQALEEALKYLIDAKEKKTLNEVESLADTTKKSVDEILKDLRESHGLIGELTGELDKKDKALREALTEHLHDDRYAPGKHQHDVYAIKENVDELTIKIRGAVQELSDNTSTNFENMGKNLSNAVVIINEIIKVHESEANKALRELNTAIQERLNTFEGGIKQRVEERANVIQTNVAQATIANEYRVSKFEEFFQKAIQSLKDGIASIISSSEKNTTRLEKVITKGDEKSLKAVTKLKERVDTHFDQVEEKVKEIAKEKANKTDVLLQSDLDSIQKSIAASIPVPKDGENAHEWEFKNHPNQQGILLFKRDDWKDWKKIVLTGKAHSIYDQNSGGGAGGGTAFDTYDIVDPEFNQRRSRFFVGSTTTDVDGKFSFNIGQYAQAEIIFYANVVSKMIQDLSLPLHERITFATIHTIQPNVANVDGLVEGYVLRQRRRTNLLGLREVYSMVPAPAGIEVQIALISRAP